MFLNYSQVLWLTSENVLMKPSQLWRGGCEPSYTVYWSQQQEQDTIEMLHQLILPQGRVQSGLGGGLLFELLLKETRTFLLYNSSNNGNDNKIFLDLIHSFCITKSTLLLVHSSSIS